MPNMHASAARANLPCRLYSVACLIHIRHTKAKPNLSLGSSRNNPSTHHKPYAFISGSLFHSKYTQRNTVHLALQPYQPRRFPTDVHHANHVALSGNLPQFSNVCAMSSFATGSPQYSRIVYVNIACFCSATERSLYLTLSL